MAPTTKIIGVNSILKDGNHILLWDFDHVPIEPIKNELRWIQAKYRLPRIIICKTSKIAGFHAYCFKKVTWRQCVEIIASSHLMDWNYFKYGIYRQKFTLRVFPKCGRKIEPYMILDSPYKEDATIEDLTSWVQYETLTDSHKSRKVELKLFAKD